MGRWGWGEVHPWGSKVSASNAYAPNMHAHSDAIQKNYVTSTKNASYWQRWQNDQKALKQNLCSERNTVVLGRYVCETICRFHQNMQWQGYIVYTHCNIRQEDPCLLALLKEPTWP